MIFNRRLTRGQAVEDRIHENNDMLDKARAALNLAKDRAAETNKALHDFLGMPVQSDHQTLEETAYACKAAGVGRALALDEVISKFVAVGAGLRKATDDYEAAGVEFEAAYQSLCKVTGRRPVIGRV